MAGDDRSGTATIEPAPEAPAPPAAPVRRGRVRWVQWLAGFLIVVLGAELAVRVLADRLPEPLDHFSVHAQRTVNDLEALEAAGVRSDLTFVGTSMVRRDIDANRAEELMPGIEWAHNVALPGAQTPVVERWMLEEVVPRIEPRRVVWGISSIDFNDGRPNKTIDQYELARATERGWYADADRALQRFAVSDHRDVLRDPLQLERSLTGTAADYDRARPLGDRAVWELGYPKTSEEQLRRIQANHLVTVRDRQLADFRTGERELRAYRRTLDALRERGIEVAVVIMPVPSTYVEAHPDGARDFDAWKDEVRAASGDVPVLDMADTMADEDFRDLEHLYMPAAREFTALLADELQALGWSPP